MVLPARAFDGLKQDGPERAYGEQIEVPSCPEFFVEHGWEGTPRDKDREAGFAQGHFV